MVKPFPKTYENFKFQISWEDLDLSQVKEVIKLGLYEDAGGKFHSLKKFPDITTKACKINNSGEALIVSRTLASLILLKYFSKKYHLHNA